jgi:hypothetical protein
VKRYGPSSIALVVLIRHVLLNSRFDAKMLKFARCTKRRNYWPSNIHCPGRCGVQETCSSVRLTSFRNHRRGGLPNQPSEGAPWADDAQILVPVAPLSAVIPASRSTD